MRRKMTRRHMLPLRRAGAAEAGARRVASAPHAGTLSRRRGRTMAHLGEKSYNKLLLPVIAPPREQQQPPAFDDFSILPRVDAVVIRR